MPITSHLPVDIPLDRLAYKAFLSALALEQMMDGKQPDSRKQAALKEVWEVVTRLSQARHLDPLDLLAGRVSLPSAPPLSTFSALPEGMVVRLSADEALFAEDRLAHLQSVVEWLKTRATDKPSTPQLAGAQQVCAVLLRSIALQRELLANTH